MTAVALANFFVFVSLLCGIAILSSQSNDCSVIKDTYWGTARFVNLGGLGDGDVYLGLRHMCIESNTGVSTTYELSDECETAGKTAISFSVFSAVAMLVSLLIGLRRQTGNDSFKMIGVVLTGAALVFMTIALSVFDAECIEEPDEMAVTRGPSFGLAVLIMLLTFTSTLLYSFDADRSAKVFFMGVAALFSLIFNTVVLASADDSCETLKDTYWTKFETTSADMFLGLSHVCISTWGVTDDGAVESVVEYSDGDCKDSGEVATGFLSLSLIFLLISFLVAVNRMMFQNHGWAKAGAVMSGFGFVCVTIAFAVFDRNCLENEDEVGNGDQEKGVSFGVCLVLLFTTLMQTVLAIMEPGNGSGGTSL